MPSVICIQITVIWGQRRLFEEDGASKEENQKEGECGRQYIQSRYVRRSWVVMGDKVDQVLWYIPMPRFLNYNMEMIMVTATQGCCED